MPAGAHPIPEGGDHALTVGQHRAAAEELDLPASDPESPQPPERLGGAALRIGEQGVGESQALGPGAIVLDRVGIDAGDLDPGALVFGMAFAKLAKLAQSARRPVQDVEEQDQRPAWDELSQPIILAARVVKREIGQRPSEQAIRRWGGSHAGEPSRTRDRFRPPPAATVGRAVRSRGARAPSA